MSRPVSDRSERAARTPILRARRIPVDVERMGPAVATMRHPGVGTITGDVQDLSLMGVAVVLPVRNDVDGLLLSGDRLDGLEITVGGRLLYQGSGVIRRLSEESDRQIVGIEVEEPGLDLGELYRTEARQSFAQRLQALESSARDDQISATFKAWVADMRSQLETVREFLRQEELALAGEDRLTREEKEAEYLELLRPRFVAAMERMRDRLNEAVDNLAEHEHAIYRAYCRRHLVPLILESPFARRSLEKPLGYAGDYEMMNMLYRDHAEGETLFGKALNLYATSEVVARANINRIEYLGEKIRRAIAASDRGRVRIASIGCGPAREVSELLQKSPELGERLEVALIDQEDRSIAFCERTLTPLVRTTGLRVQFIRESVRRLLSTKRLGQALGTRELIYSAGLFDYLADRSFQALLQVLWEAIHPGGSLVVGNVAEGNPSRWIMEYVLDWFLIHRSPADLLRLGEGLSPEPTRMEVESEPTGVNLFLVAHR